MTHYLVLGAGMQGTAAVHDLIRHGGATAITWVERDAAQLEASMRRIQELCTCPPMRGQRLDAGDRRALQPLFTEAQVCLNALPYRFALGMTQLALEGRCHYLDLGGNTEIVREQLDMHRAHRSAAELCVLPDCGLMPGMGNVFLAYALQELGDLASATVRCGGLPQDPRPPLGYTLLFSVAGLTNEYFGSATVLRDGQRAEVRTFAGLEELELPGVGRCEAFITSGGLSTSPWSFAGRIGNLDYKTVRYPGHHAKFEVLLDLGLLDEDPVLVDGQRIVPRHLLHERLERALKTEDRRDLVVLRCTAVAKAGKSKAAPRQLVIDVVDRYDEATGFTAMERTTAYSASACAAMVAKGEIAPGPRPLEQAVDPKAFVKALIRRGIDVTLDG